MEYVHLRMLFYGIKCIQIVESLSYLLGSIKQEVKFQKKLIDKDIFIILKV